MSERDEGPDELAKVLHRNGLGWNTLNPWSPDTWTADRRGSVSRLPKAVWLLGGLLVVVIIVIPLAAVVHAEWIAS